MDFSSALGAKYAIMAQQADGQAQASLAQANLANAQAGVVGSDAAARNRLMATQGTDNLSHANLANEQANVVAPTAAADNRYKAAMGLNAIGGYHASEAQANSLNQETIGKRYNPDANQISAMDTIFRPQAAGDLNSAIPKQRSVFDDRSWKQQTYTVPHLAKGTARVPGKGDGTKDTVDAKLAPGEAVLNKPAAEMVGRGLIAHLNAHGAAQMGMVPPTAAEQAGSSHAKGTAKVSASKKEPLLTPQMLQMLMQMQGGGAGAPGGGGGILTAAPQAQQLGMP